MDIVAEVEDKEFSAPISRISRQIIDTFISSVMLHRSSSHGEAMNINHKIAIETEL